MKNVTHLREVARECEICDFVEGPRVRGFDPKGIFVAHLNFVGYSNLIKIFIPQDIEGNIWILKTFIRTNVKKFKDNKSQKIETRRRVSSSS